MSQFGDVLKNIVLLDSGTPALYNRIFVVSAYNNVTNWLLEHKKTGEPGIYINFVNNSGFSQALDSLLKKLLEINHGFKDLKLDLEVADQFITDRINQARNYLNALADVLATGYIDKSDIHLAAREILASIGEAHSAFNSVNIINNHGVKALFVDLCGFNDSEYLTIDERIVKAFKGIDFTQVLPVATGYTKGTEGIMREFDRGYSEVTFSKIAVALKADEAVIHKEFHLSSADPKIVGVDKSVAVGFTNYNVADQLADLGMEAIHPRASKPLEISGINIRIKNTFEPGHPGTLISKDYVSEQSRVEIITGSDKLKAIDIHDPFMVGTVGFDLGIMEHFRKYATSYVLKATNANSITTVVWEKDLCQELIDALKSSYYEVTLKNVALVCVIGSNIAIPGILAKASQALADRQINIEAFSQSLKQVNMQFVVRREDFNEAIKALHDALCTNR